MTSGFDRILFFKFTERGENLTTSGLVTLTLLFYFQVCSGNKTAVLNTFSNIKHPNKCPLTNAKSVYISFSIASFMSDMGLVLM